MPRIELGLHRISAWECELNAFPLNHNVGLPRIELGLRVPKTRVLPVYDSPTL